MTRIIHTREVVNNLLETESTVSDQELRLTLLESERAILLERIKTIPLEPAKPMFREPVKSILPDSVEPMLPRMWIAEELEYVDIGDNRLNQRLYQIVEELSGSRIEYSSSNRESCFNKRDIPIFR